MKVKVLCQVSSVNKSSTTSKRKGGKELITLKLLSKHCNSFILLIWGRINLKPHLPSQCNKLQNGKKLIDLICGTNLNLKQEKCKKCLPKSQLLA